MKKVAVFGLCLAMIPGVVLAEAPRTIEVFLKGENISVQEDVNPIIREDRTFLPVRMVAEKLGYDVTWNGDSREVSVKNKEKSISMRISGKEYLDNGEKKSMDVAPFIYKDRTYVPIRFVGESLDLEVNWDNTNRVVKIGNYRETKELKDSQEVVLKNLGVKFMSNPSFRENIVMKEEEGKWVFYDKTNYENKEVPGGYIGELRWLEDPVTEVNSLLLGEKEGKYLCFLFPGDVNYDPSNPDMIIAYEKSENILREIFHTIEWNK